MAMSEPSWLNASEETPVDRSRMQESRFFDL